MNYLKAICSRKYTFFALAVSISFCVVISLPHSTGALSRWFAEDGRGENGQPDSTVIVSEQDATLRLDAPISTFKVFAPSSNFNIVLQEICTSYPYSNPLGISYSVNETVRYWPNNSNEDTVGSGASINTASVCSGSGSIALPISGAQRTSRRGDITLYSATVSVIRNTPKIGAFRVLAPIGGYTTYKELDLADAQSNANPRNSISRPSFAIIDRQFYNPNERSYTLRFGTDCNLRSSTRVYLKWEDADVARSNEDGDISFDLYDDTVSTTTPILSRSGAGLMGGAALDTDGAFGQVQFNAVPDHNYRWVWRNVNGNNGIQVWMPFNQINYIANCGDYDYRARLHSTTTPARNSTVRPGDDIVIRGDARNAGSIAGPNYRYDIYRTRGANSYISQVALSSGGSWVAADHARWTGGSIGAGGNTANRAARYRVTNNAPDGAEICFITRVSPRTSNNSGWHYNPSASGDHWCYTVNNPAWNYIINRSGPSNTATFPKPGNNITISSRVRNNGDGTGASYSHRFRVTRGGGLLTNSSAIRYSGLGGLASGSGRTRNATFRVASDASHNGQVCFIAEVAPYRGYTYPLPPSATSSGWRSSNEICYTIYNQRFELENSPNIGFNPSSAGAGEDVDVSYSINNSDSTELNRDYPNAATGPTPNLSVRTRVTTGNASVTTGNPNAGSGRISWGSSFQQTLTVTIDNDVQVGDNVCVRVFVNWEQGYSDGTGLADNPAVDDTRCFNVSDGPYLQVLGHDTWAGGAYSIDGSCSVSGAGDILSNARPSLTSSGTGVGAMDQYAAFAEGTVSDFGTANDALSSTLTFANDSGLGNFGADRCLANLFDSGGAGGNIDDGLWGNAKPIDTNDFNSNSGVFNGNADGQFRINSNTAWNNNGPPLGAGFEGNATILINGDLEIRADIILDDTLTVGNVPLLVFIVSGNIRIEDDVNRMDGIYVSYRQIDTCNRFSSGSLSPVRDLTADDCDEHLEVNGALIANDIAFRRTHGGTNEAATGNNLSRCLGASTPYYNDNNRRCAGESIIFHSWFWLAEPHFDRGGGPEANQYPIQQLRDLPPIF